MNADDINSRIKRLYLALGKNVDDNIAEHILIEHRKTKTGGAVSISFGGKDDELELEEQVMSVIAHLAKLKDHLKNELELRGFQRSLIEDEINQSESLQLIIDLDNAEKHGTKLHKPRSDKKPKVINLQHAITQKNSNEPSVFQINPFSGEFKSSNSVITITGDVVDKNGVRICSISNLITEALETWERFIDKYEILSIK